MLTHEFVTANGDVQRTTFSDGTEAVVNFGEKPYEATVGAPSASWGERIRRQGAKVRAVSGAGRGKTGLYPRPPVGPTLPS